MSLNISKRIVVTAALLKLVTILLHVTICISSGIAGAVVTDRAIKLFIGDVPLMKVAPWGGLIVILGFAATFIVTTYYVGQITENIMIDIGAWAYYHQPCLVKWSNNGVVGMVRVKNCREVMRQNRYNLPVDKVIPPVLENVMTFSDQQPLGRVTGSIDDLAKLEKDCLTVWMPFFVPLSSRVQSNAPVIPLDKAYRIVHGRARRVN